MMDAHKKRNLVYDAMRRIAPRATLSTGSNFRNGFPGVSVTVTGIELPQLKWDLTREIGYIFQVWLITKQIDIFTQVIEHEVHHTLTYGYEISARLYRE